MKVLIVSYFNRWITHLGTELELAEKHISNGDSVTFLACDGSIGACMNNPAGNKDICKECILRRADGIMALSGDVRVFPLKAPQISRKTLCRKYISESPTVDDFRKLRYQGCDLGWGALSTTIKIHRDPLCESEEAMRTAKKSLAAACRSFEATTNFLHAHPDFHRAYVFNGRFAETRGSLRAIQNAQLKVFTHERGCSTQHYQLFPDTLPHDLDLFRKRLQESWESSEDPKSRGEIADEFYHSRRSGNPLNWVSFTEKQEAGALPEGWDSEKRNVVIYNSSEDEFVAVGDMFTNPVYRFQAEAVSRIVADTLASGEHIHYYLRIHPNLAEVKNSTLTNLLSVKAPNLTIIGADENISTYSLLDACDCVLTFGSTVGAEATYWGKPSILAGVSYYSTLEVAYEPRNHNEVMGLLLDKSLEPKSRLGALKYGYHMRTRGIKFEYWKPDDFSSGTFGNLFMSTPSNTSSGSLTINNRKEMESKIFLLFMNLCKSRNSLQRTDRIAKYIALVYHQLKKRIRIRRRVSDLAKHLRLR